jgi:hypothetical protein
MYGTKPIKLAAIIIKNTEVVIPLKPLICVINVRPSCLKINEFRGSVALHARKNFPQYNPFTITRINALKHRSKLIDGRYVLNTYGSKDEKMSDIISKHGESI